jgi:hypothetical protein
MRENPCFDRCVCNCDVLDELKAPAPRSTASLAMIGSSITANRMIHKL